MGPGFLGRCYIYIYIYIYYIYICIGFREGKCPSQALVSFIVQFVFDPEATHASSFSDWSLGDFRRLERFFGENEDLEDFQVLTGNVNVFQGKAFDGFSGSSYISDCFMNDSPFPFCAQNHKAWVELLKSKNLRLDFFALGRFLFVEQLMMVPSSKQKLVSTRRGFRFDLLAFQKSGGVSKKRSSGASVLRCFCTWHFAPFHIPLVFFFSTRKKQVKLHQKRSRMVGGGTFI